MSVTSVQGQGLNNIISGKSADKMVPFGSERKNSNEVDFSKSATLPNRDKFVLNLPTTETIYKRQELTTDKSMSEGCAYYSSYTERVLEFGSGTLTSISNDGYFVINMDKYQQTFGKSDADRNDIDHAVEETWERIERSLEQTEVSGSLWGLAPKNGHIVGGLFGFSMQSSIYKELSVSVTKGSVSYKDGAKEAYLEKAMSFREIFNLSISAAFSALKK